MDNDKPCGTLDLHLNLCPELDAGHGKVVQNLIIQQPLPLHAINGGARGVVVIAVGNEHGDTSSNPGRD